MRKKFSEQPLGPTSNAERMALRKRRQGTRKWNPARAQRLLNATMELLHRQDQRNERN
jgi:hypothetical protein